MSVVVTAKNIAVSDRGFAPGTWAAATGTTLGAGDYYVFITVEGSSPTITSVSVDTVTQTTPLATNTTIGNTIHGVYLCSGVTASSGNINVVFGGAPNATSLSWILVTGGGTPTSSATAISSYPNPGSNSVTVPSTGVTLATYTVASATVYNPITWTGCVSSSSLQDCNHVSASNGGDIYINYATATGTVTATPTANWTGQAGTFIAVNIPPAGAGGPTVSGWNTGWLRTVGW